jgi:uncharacterized protein
MLDLRMFLTLAGASGPLAVMHESLMWTVQRGDVDELRKLVTEEPRCLAAVDSSNSTTPLMLAGIYWHMMMTLARDDHARARAIECHPPPTFLTPSALPARQGHLAAAALLLDHGAAVDARNWQGQTALYLASFWGRDPVASLLLKRGADPVIADCEVSQSGC